MILRIVLCVYGEFLYRLDSLLETGIFEYMTEILVYKCLVFVTYYNTIIINRNLTTLYFTTILPKQHQTVFKYLYIVIGLQIIIIQRVPHCLSYILFDYQ